MRRVLPAIVLVVVLAVAALYFFAGRTAAGPEQPIAFSHKNHAETRQIDCLYCHSGADDGAVAGIPPLETCMGCHRTVGANNPEVQKLRQYWDRQEQVQWAKVTLLPDHVTFAHKPHVAAGVECLTCHAQGASSDQWFQTFSPGMAWCLSCHSSRQASTDCWTCHK